MKRKVVIHGVEEFLIMCLMVVAAVGCHMAGINQKEGRSGGLPMEREGGFSGRPFKKHPRVTAWEP